ncbi:hypothetical protein JTE90_018633 [Oedothorax gibbosus]|uniref:Uncharacterized protein n=1 Tax=Oedothorax gibbosus TaxID=931172 RepID=A0AAV6UNY2_9ARAC|nr:hypothetical protein JTE90_018633 [Oedothorax gibbosus]
MKVLLLSWFLLLDLVASSPVDSGRLLVDSRPILFEEDFGSTEVVNSTLVLKKKDPSGPKSSDSGGPVYYNTQKPEFVISNHNVEGTVWKRPQTPLTSVISNHKSYSNWNHKWLQKLSQPTQAPPHTKDRTSQYESSFVVINNHKSNKHPISRPPKPSYEPQYPESGLHNPTSEFHKPSSAVTVVDSTPAPQVVTNVLGERVKAPEVIKSATINVLNPTHLATTILHNKLIVLQKRTDQLASNDVQVQIHQKPVKAHKPPNKLGNFSVAPVMDPWSNIPLPSKPSWATSSPAAASASYPVKGLSQQPVRGGFAQASQPAATQTVLPNLPFMPFLSSLISPLLSKPLTPSALNSGMQGIKAMQSFLRNSLLGAMFCFLPSAFIALSLTATQRILVDRALASIEITSTRALQVKRHN